MILGFKSYFPWGEPTLFFQKIIASVAVDPVNPQASPGNMFSSYQPKIHSIREGQRFKAGDLLHMATGVRSKHYNQFNKGIEQLSRVKSVQRFDLACRNPDRIILFVDRQIMYVRNFSNTTHIENGLDWMHEFAMNDGFQDIDQFFRWFRKPIRNGQVIHWTDKKYTNGSTL